MRQLPLLAAVLAAGLASFAPPASALSPAPGCIVPDGVVDHEGGLILSWEPAEGALVYDVWRIEEGSETFEHRGSVVAANGTTFADSVEVGVLYGYVVGYNGQDPDACEEILLVTDDPGGCFEAGYCPPCPDPQAQALTEGGIEITWTADGRVVEWAILRGTSPDEMFELVALLEGDVTTFVDEDVEAGVTYYYLLAGLSDDGVGGFCEEPIAVTAVPFFGAGALGAGLAALGAVGVFVVLRRRA